MNLLAALLWLANIVIDSLGHVAFKFAAKDGSEEIEQSQWLQLARRPWLWLGIVCFVLEFLIWLAFLSLLPLSQGVLLGAFNIVVLMLVGRWVFNERLTRWRIVGMSLISLGVALVGLG